MHYPPLNGPIHSLLGNLGDYTCKRLGVDPMTLTPGEIKGLDRTLARISDDLVRVLESGMAPKQPMEIVGIPPHQPMAMSQELAEEDNLSTLTDPHRHDPDPESERGSLNEP